MSDDLAGMVNAHLGVYLDFNIPFAGGGGTVIETLGRALRAVLTMHTMEPSGEHAPGPSTSTQIGPEIWACASCSHRYAPRWHETEPPTCPNGDQAWQTAAQHLGITEETS